MKNLKYILFLILLIIIPKNVYAECTTSEFNKLKISAISAEIKYNYIDDNKFEIIITNLSSDFYIEDINAKTKITVSNDVTTKTISNYIGGKSYTFNFFGSTSSSCPHQLLRVQTLSIPKFNPYSKREECIGNESFDLCNKWYPGTIKETEFIERLNTYIKDKENTNNNTNNDDNKQPIVEKTLWDNIMDYLNQEYIMLLAIIAVAGIIGIILLKIFKRR